MRGQGGSEGQGAARSASKSSGAKKQTSEQTPSSTNQGASANPGASQGQRPSPAQGGAANQGTSMGQGTQQTSSNPSGTGQQTGGEQDLLQHAKHAGGEIMSKVQQQAGSQLNRQKETAASQLSQVANAVRRLGENLPQEEAGALGQFVRQYGDKAANGLERLGTYIREQDPKQFLNDVQNFGRRQPVLLLGGAFLLGFAGARLIRSSMGAGSSMDTGDRQGSMQMNVQTPRPTSQNVSGAGQSINPGAV